MRLSSLIFFMFFVASASCQDFSVIENGNNNAENNKIAKNAVVAVENFYSEKTAKESKSQACHPYKDEIFDSELVTLMSHGVIKSIKILNLDGYNLEVNVLFENANTVVALSVELKNHQCNSFILERTKLYVDPKPPLNKQNSPDAH